VARDHRSAGDGCDAGKPFAHGQLFRVAQHTRVHHVPERALVAQTVQLDWAEYRRQTGATRRRQTGRGGPMHALLELLWRAVLAAADGIAQFIGFTDFRRRRSARRKGSDRER
jgi:hypothetical protein